VDAPFENRVRGWLGDSEPEFDVAFFARRDISLAEFATQRAVQYGGGNSLLNEWKVFFKKHNIEKLVQGLVVVQRHEARRPAFTTRRFLGDLTTRDEVEWQLRLEVAAVEPQFLDRLRVSHLHAPSHMDLVVRHRLSDKAFQAQEVRLGVEHPFAVECKVEPWTGRLLALCDGTITAAELFEVCKKDQIIHPETPEREFLAFLKSLVLGSFLECDAFPMPAPHARKQAVVS
jgi:hypothetical protein